MMQNHMISIKVGDNELLEVFHRIFLELILNIYKVLDFKDFRGSAMMEAIKYKFIYLALFFSWWGDIFLMFPRNEASPNAKLLFISGLVSFLIGHFNYIIHFIKEMKSITKVTVIVEKPYLVLPFLLFIFLFLRLMYPTLGTMKIPVTVYGIVITSMMLMAFNRKNIVNSTSFYLVFAGALLFVFSDSCIAVNLFYKPFELARMVIMSTYIIAQFLIIKGILKAEKPVV